MSSPGDASPRAFSPACRRKGELITTVIVWLLLGAVVNVAVAWGLAIRSNPLRQLSRSSVEIRWTAENRVERSVLGVVETLRCVRSFVSADAEIEIRESSMPDMQYQDFEVDPQEFIATLPHWSLVRSRHPVEDFEDADSFIEFATGWPFVSLHGMKWYLERDLNQIEPRMRQTGVLTLPAHWVIDEELAKVDPFAPQLRNELPLIPIWPGFAINTFVYAAILWLLFATPGTVRRWRRIRRGLCVKCAYPVGASDVCTECGAQIRKTIRGRGSMSPRVATGDGLPPPAPSAGDASTP